MARRRCNNSLNFASSNHPTRVALRPLTVLLPPTATATLLPEVCDALRTASIQSIGTVCCRPFGVNTSTSALATSTRIYVCVCASLSSTSTSSTRAPKRRDTVLALARARACTRAHKVGRPRMFMQQHKHRHAIFFGLRCCRVCSAGYKSKTRHSTRSHETGSEPQSSRPAPCFDQSWTESMQ